MKYAYSGKKRQFTLIELLVAIAIITILSGRLLPALDTASKKVVSINCPPDIKQFGTAATQYNMDYHRGFASMVWDGTYSKWSAFIFSYIYPNVKQNYSSQVPQIIKYSTNSFGAYGVFRCPAQPHHPRVRAFWKGKDIGTGNGPSSIDEKMNLGMKVEANVGFIDVHTENMGDSRFPSGSCLEKPFLGQGMR